MRLHNFAIAALLWMILGRIAGIVEVQSPYNNARPVCRDKLISGEFELVVARFPQLVGRTLESESIPGDKGSREGGYQRAYDIQMRSDFSERERDYVVRGALFCGLCAPSFAGSHIS